jgi:hypothetical protein
MTRDEIIQRAREAGFDVEVQDIFNYKPQHSFIGSDENVERFANLIAAAEREQWPNLDPVINWLENGCDPKEAAKELRLYAAAIRARTTS